MDPLTDDIETWLAQLEESFWCEIANHEIGSIHACQYPSATAARRAMLREAFLAGMHEAARLLGQITPRDFDADVQRLHDYNEAQRKNAHG